MSFYRSDPVGHYKLVIPRQNAWHIMNLLGQMDMIHFVKSQKLIQHNPFNAQIKRCQESLNKLHDLQQALFERRLYKPTQYFTQQQLKQLYRQLAQKHRDLGKQKSASIIDEVQDQLTLSWKTFNGFRERYQTLLRNVQFYRQNIAIIIAGQRMFGMQRLTRSSLKSYSGEGYFGQVYENQGVLRIHYGIIDKTEEPQFQRSIFRVSRGHSFVQFIPLSDIFEEVSDAEKTKSVYFLIFQGMKNSYVEKKLLKLTQSYNKAYGKSYQVPFNSDEQNKILKELTKSFNESQNLLRMVEGEIQTFLREKVLGYDERKIKPSSQKLIKHLEKYSKIQMMKIYLLRELQIYSNLREMDVYNNFLQAQIYVKYTDFQDLKQRLISFEMQSHHPSVHIIPISESLPGRSRKKPTSFEKNSYTRSAQQIVETYGIAKYREANPSIFTCVTFPFLFGVMFGDIGHGLLLFLFGLIMIFKKYELAEVSEIFVMIIPHRYLFALMGFFSTYCGFIYNDFLSINLNLFGSCYNPSLVQQHMAIPREQGCIYPFGVDPVWAVAQNNLNYINSLKMKIAVIIGVIHMTLGVFVKATNSLYYKRKVEFWFQTVPQLIFLVLVFGYMDFLIIFKWLKPWGYGNVHAPSIITTMINLPLMLGKTDKQCCHGGQPMWGSAAYTSQQPIQKFILFVVFLCVPIMLLVKPIYQIKKHNAHHSTEQNHQRLENTQLSQQNQHDNNNDGYSVFADQQEDAEVIQNTKIPFSKTTKTITGYQIRHDVDYPSDQSHQASQIFVHQMIETIEFVLGCISNTASYLRLWALSLAHSQLAQVFMEKTLVGSLEQGYIGIVGMIILFPLFAAATFGVLMCMDVMECFLHTLRLHWVEFQNKFYKGDGYAFSAFSFHQKINTEIRKMKLQEPEPVNKEQ